MNPRRMLAALLTAVVLTASVASASYKDDYMRGKNAAESGNWTEAAQYMRRAIQDEPGSKRRFKPYGTLFIPYVPHFYLGEALARLGQCDQALAAFAESERQGVIQSLNEYQRLQDSRRQCQRSVPPTRAPQPTRAPAPTATRGIDPQRLQNAVDAARAAVDRAARAEDAVRAASRRTDNQAAWSSQPTLARSLDEGSTLLEQARSKLQLGTSRQLLDELEQATALATRAAGTLAGVTEELKRARKRLTDEAERRKQQQREQLIREIEVLAASARTVISEYQRLPQSARSDLYEKKRAVEIVVDAAAGAGSLSLSRLQALREQLPSLTDHLQRGVAAAARAAGQPSPAIPTPRIPTPPPQPTFGADTPAALRAAVVAFLKADYGATVEQLGGSFESLEPRAQAVAHLFRAAARYFLYIEGGSSKSALMEQAATDVRQARSRDAAVLPIDDVFSPSFIQFFDSVK